MHNNVFANYIIYVLIVESTIAVPYLPAHIFVSSQHDGSLAYLLWPKTSAQDELEFVSLNTSEVDPSNPQVTALSEPAPFQNPGGGATFVPMVDPEGDIMVYTGDCHASANTAVIWSFSANNNSSTGDGTWSQLPVMAANGVESGPNYLAAGFTYSVANRSSSSLYVFGGMCPSGQSSLKDWVSAANYSRDMVALNPPSTPFDGAYNLKMSVLPVAPIAEAGFTITSLQATYSTTPTGEVVEQQNYVLVGGHTRGAFINMSRIALFSLPEESWSFIDVGSSSGTGVEPRSGHTTVLSSDGSRLIVFGGWVGNTSVAAEPQLATLELGEAYGGSGQWAWNVPPQANGAGFSQGSGIFGHGATMLPGDVMMIAGGYAIGSTSQKRSTSDLTLSPQIYLYNVTSNTWLSGYTNPFGQPVPKSQSESQSPLSSIGQKAGLGVGLAVSAVVLGIFCVLLCQRRKRRRVREQQLRKLSLGAERPHLWDEVEAVAGFNVPGMSQLRVHRTVPESVDPEIKQGSHDDNSTEGPDVERTGLLGGSHRGVRRGRTYYYPPVTGRYEDSGRNHGQRGSIIHPIDERDEYEDVPEDSGQGANQQDSKRSSTPDPFSDHLFSPDGKVSPTKGDILDLRTGVEDLASSSSCGLERNRSLSPDKSERTNSNLSESSTSATTTSPLQRLSLGSVKRGIAHKSVARLSRSITPILDRSSSASGSRNDSPQKDYDRFTLDTVVSSAERSLATDSSLATHSSLSPSHAEESLLLGEGSGWVTPPESPPKTSTGSRTNPYGFLGTVRKTLSGARKASSNVERFLGGKPWAATADDQRNLTLMTSQLTSNEVEYLQSKTPRRAASASAALLTRKRGPKDWATDKRTSGTNSLSHTLWASDDFSLHHYGLGESSQHHLASSNRVIEPAEYEEDWDVEAAAESRLVQVTFTVPKEKLRVVNPGVSDDDDNDSGDNENGNRDENTLNRPQRSPKEPM